MRVLLTGAGGHIGTAVTAELASAGHHPVGLVRSASSAEAVRAAGGDVVLGDVDDSAALAAAVADVDAVVHLAFDNGAVVDGRMADAAAADLAVVRTLGDALAGTGTALIGIGLATAGDPDQDRMLERNPRTAIARELLALQQRGIRTMLMAVPPVTHSDRDRHGFLPIMIGLARQHGVSRYVGTGENRWAAAHTLDLAVLYRLALESAPPGTQLVGAAETGIPVREVAEAIGRRLGLPTESIPADRMGEHFGEFVFAGWDMTMPQNGVAERLGWAPTRPGLLADLDGDHYSVE